MKKPFIHIFIVLATSLLAMPGLAQTPKWFERDTTWFERDTTQEKKIANDVIKKAKAKVEECDKQKYLYHIKAAFDLLFQSADVDSLYDWSSVDKLQNDLDEKTKRLNALKDSIAQAQPNEEEEPQQQWASEKEVKEYEQFQKRIREEINELDQIKPDTLVFINDWTESKLNKQLEELEQVAEVFKDWNPEFDAMPDEQMIKKFNDLKDQLADLELIKDPERISSQLKRKSAANAAEQFEQNIINYLASKPFNAQTTNSYIQQYKEQGKNKKLLLQALENHAAVHQKIIEYLDRMKGLERLSEKQHGDLLARIDSYINDTNGQYYNKNENDYHHYYGNIQKVLNKFKTDISKGGWNNGNLQIIINEARNKL